MTLTCQLEAQKVMFLESSERLGWETQSEPTVQKWTQSTSALQLRDRRDRTKERDKDRECRVQRKTQRREMTDRENINTVRQREWHLNISRHTEHKPQNVCTCTRKHLLQVEKRPERPERRWESREGWCWLRRRVVSSGWWGCNTPLGTPDHQESSGSLSAYEQADAWLPTPRSLWDHVSIRRKRHVNFPPSIKCDVLISYILYSRQFFIKF